GGGRPQVEGGIVPPSCLDRTDGEVGPSPDDHLRAGPDRAVPVPGQWCVRIDRPPRILSAWFGHWRHDESRRGSLYTRRHLRALRAPPIFEGTLRPAHGGETNLVGSLRDHRLNRKRVRRLLECPDRGRRERLGRTAQARCQAFDLLAPRWGIELDRT